MATYLDGMDGGKHNSDNIESKSVMHTYTVSVTFECMDAKTPKEAALKAAKWLVEDEDAFMMIYDVIDEQTNEAYTVDLSEDDETISTLLNN